MVFRIRTMVRQRVEVWTSDCRWTGHAMNIQSSRWLALLCAASGGYVAAQQNQGFTFTGTTAYTSSSNAGADASGSAATTGTLLGGGGSATFGWFRGNSVRGLSISYTPSYFFSKQGSYSAGSFLSHNLVLTGTAKLRPKLFMEFSAAGQVVRSEENLFATAVSGRADGASTSPADLLQKSGDAQILQSLTSALAVGSRYLNSAVALGLAYRATPRLSIEFRTSGTRLQTLERDGPGLLFATTGGMVGAGISYSVSPRTQVSAEVNSQQLWSQLDRTRTTNMTGSITHSMGRQWFVQLHAGAGQIDSGQSTVPRQAGSQFVGGGEVGFKTGSHTLMATVMRSVADPYGLQASSTVSVSGAWNWQKAGRPWSVFASGGNQTLALASSTNITIWHASAGWTRVVNRETDISIAYAHGTVLTAPQLPSMPYTFMGRHGVQLTFRWHPPRIPK